MSYREILIQWLKEISTASAGEEIFLPTDSRQLQLETVVAIKRELRIMAEIDPVQAAQIRASKVFKDGKLWVVLKKIPHSPLLGFKKGMDGVIERVNLEDLSSKKRRWKLMRIDGYSTEEIVESEGDLTEEDIIFLKGGSDV